MHDRHGLTRAEIAPRADAQRVGIAILHGARDPSEHPTRARGAALHELAIAGDARDEQEADDDHGAEQPEDRGDERGAFVLRAPGERGATGTHWLILGREAALALASDADAETVDLDVRHQEAIRDTLNQLLLAAGPPLLPLFARSVAYQAATVHVSAGDVLAGDLTMDQRVWVAHAEAKSDALRIPIALTIDEPLAREISALGAGEEPIEAVETRAQAPAAELAAPPAKIDLILDVTLPVAVELGRARMQIQDILKLAPGSVIALDKSAGDPVELLINDRPFAKGEVVIIDENFGVRLTSIVTATERIRTLR